MNIPLLKKVAQFIAENPDKYNQLSLSGPCCCIAGHALRLADSEQSSLTDAVTVLGLNNDQAITLILSPSIWPHPFRRDFEEAKTNEQRANAAYDRIEHLIQTGN